MFGFHIQSHKHSEIHLICQLNLFSCYLVQNFGVNNYSWDVLMVGRFPYVESALNTIPSQSSVESRDGFKKRPSNNSFTIGIRWALSIRNVWEQHDLILLSTFLDTSAQHNIFINVWSTRTLTFNLVRMMVGGLDDFRFALAVSDSIKATNSLPPQLGCLGRLGALPPCWSPPGLHWSLQQAN